jgi:hypothetical protein
MGRTSGMTSMEMFSSKVLSQPSPVLSHKKAAKIYWKERSIQLVSCDLDSSLPLPPCMEDDVGRYIKGVFVDTASAMAQSPNSIALSSDETLLMPGEKENLKVDLPGVEDKENPGDMSNMDIQVRYSLPVGK